MNEFYDFSGDFDLGYLPGDFTPSGPANVYATPTGTSYEEPDYFNPTPSIDYDSPIYNPTYQMDNTDYSTVTENPAGQSGGLWDSLGNFFGSLGQAVGNVAGQAVDAYGNAIVGQINASGTAAANNASGATAAAQSAAATQKTMLIVAAIAATALVIYLVAKKAA